jgi:hypothetical protein
LEAVTYLPVAPDALASLELIYSGGRVTADRFTGVSYCLPGTPPVGFLVAVDPPTIGEAERQLLAAVPEELSEAHILSVTPQTTPAAAVGARFVATAAARWAANKAVDYAAHRAENWAHNVDKAQARARAAEARRQHAADEMQFRHGLSTRGPISEEVIERLKDLDPTAATQQLLAMRAEAIKNSP